MPLAELESAPAVALFLNRARAVRPGFALTEENAPAVAEICRRLEGLPLAIELAAARIRLLDPAALLARLAASLDALGTGAVDLPERQRTLRAMVQWSVSLLEDAERSLLEVAAVFADGWTIQAAATVAGLDQDRTLELLEEALELSLAARSTAFVTLSLAGYAQLAFAEGDPERAARLEGAAEGLRQRAGLRVWPALRHSEDELVAQVRQTLGGSQFDQAFSAGSRLTQRQVVDIARDQHGTGTQTP